jgi:hypothetical protein
MHHDFQCPDRELTWTEQRACRALILKGSKAKSVTASLGYIERRATYLQRLLWCVCAYFQVPSDVLTVGISII